MTPDRALKEMPASIKWARWITWAQAVVVAVLTVVAVAANDDNASDESRRGAGLIFLLSAIALGVAAVYCFRIRSGRRADRTVLVGATAAGLVLAVVSSPLGVLLNAVVLVLLFTKPAKAYFDPDGSAAPPKDQFDITRRPGPD